MIRFFFFRLFSGIKQKWEKHATDKNIIIYLDLPADTLVKGDKFFLELMIDNLVNNAIKYGKQNGHVLVNWNINMQTLSIEDNGIGISQKHLPFIFNRFYQVDESRSSVVKGSGLGLSIVQKLAVLQNISLNVTSKDGSGTTFSLYFPS